MTGPSDDNPFVIPPRNAKPRNAKPGNAASWSDRTLWPKWGIPNPFRKSRFDGEPTDFGGAGASFSADPKPARRWIRAASVIAICIFGVFGLHELTQKWLLSRLADDLEAHPPHVQIERLGMLAEFGEAGLPKIAAALASPDDTVSSTAFRVLRDLQGRWQTSHSEDVVDCQDTLLRSIADIVPRCPPERRPRVAELVNQIVLDTVGAEGTAETEIYRRACDLLAVVTGSAAGGSDPSVRVAGRPEEPFSDANRSEENDSKRPMLLTPLPPAASVRIVSGPTAPILTGIQSTGIQSTGIQSTGTEATGTEATDERGRDRPDSYGSSNESSVEASGESSSPRRIDNDQMPRLAPLTRSSFIVTPVQPQDASIGDNPLSAYDTRSVIDFVGSVQPALHEAAEEELRKRNFSDSDLELATRLTSPTAEVRLAMIEELPGRSDVDPRKWLIWLASDPERDVRLQAISRLGTMDDPEVREALRERLREERDPTVATRLRRFLGLR